MDGDKSNRFPVKIQLVFGVIPIFDFNKIFMYYKTFPAVRRNQNIGESDRPENISLFINSARLKFAVNKNTFFSPEYLKTGCIIDLFHPIQFQIRQRKTKNLIGAANQNIPV